MPSLFCGCWSWAEAQRHSDRVWRGKVAQQMMSRKEGGGVCVSQCSSSSSSAPSVSDLQDGTAHIGVVLPLSEWP